MNGHLTAGGMIITATHTDLALARTKILHLRTADPVSLHEEDLPA
jgi:heme exporter protein A